MNSASLEDFIDEEVVDKQGTAIGTLACYWESASGLVFLGVKIKGQEIVRVVPSVLSRIDHRHSCIRIGFDSAEVRSAPPFHCDKELKTSLEQVCSQHFHLESLQLEEKLT